MVDVLHKGKEKSYRGIEIEELKKLDLREFAKLVKSRPRRAILRNYDILEKFVKRSEKKLAKNKLIKTHDRELIIVPKMVGKTIYIYNGKEYEKVLIIEQMLGHILGEFALTRKIAKHTKAGVGATKSSASKKK
jgi:small subunit ribosomal protein S19